MSEAFDTNNESRSPRDPGAEPPKWILPFSIAVTALHGASFLSWFVITKTHETLDHAGKVEVFNGFWVLPEIIGTRLFNGILLVISILVVTLAGKIVDTDRGRLAIVLVVMNLCMVLVSGWGLL